MSKKNVILLRPGLSDRKTNKVPLELAPAQKAALLGLAKSWEQTSTRFRKLAKKELSGPDYLMAAQHALLSEGMGFCAKDLQAFIRTGKRL